MLGGVNPRRPKVNIHGVNFPATKDGVFRRESGVWGKWVFGRGINEMIYEEKTLVQVWNLIGVEVVWCGVASCFALVR